MQQIHSYDEQMQHKIYGRILSYNDDSMKYYQYSGDQQKIIG